MESQSRVKTLAMLLALALAGCTAAAVTDTATVSRPGRHEVSLPGSGVSLGGILFRPDGTAKPLPAIIVLHGWAPEGVPGAPRVEGWARRLSEQGYVALALSMRGWPPSNGRDDCGAEQPDDVIQAAEWLAALQGVNDESIGVLGFSLGGQVALLAGARSSRIKAIVAYFPITDIKRWKNTTNNAAIRDFYVPKVCGAGDLNSPVNSADKIKAPVLLIHGDRDLWVPTEQSLRMRAALQKANRYVELLVIGGGDHGFTEEQSKQAWSATTQFFNMHLRSRQ
ncbi:MAG TPA: dienelactone hydrolase family protein [Candidatus Binatia bacterium]|nr:dienelactone hydrolase family protein [Candidatus Binatia bacterium]